MISGRVSNQQTGVAVRGALLQLNAVSFEADASATAQRRQLGLPSDTSRSQYSVISGDHGKFCFERAAEGQYRLSGQKHGFLDTNYGAATPGESGVILSIVARQPRQVAFGLIPQSTISGTVTDAEGEPADSGSIQVMARIWIRGAFRYVVVRGAQPNDLGEYRVANLSAGTYYVFFQPHAGTEPVMNSAGHAAGALRGVRTFHPAAIRLTQAVPVQVGAGNDLQAVDIRVQRTATYHLRGRITGLAQKADFSAISIAPEDEDSTALVAGGGNLGANNTFDFPDMAPGVYKLTYLLAHGQTSNLARGLVEIGDRDVNDARLEVTAPVAIRGRIGLEGTDHVSMAGVQVQLNSIAAIVAPGFSAKVQTDGSFLIEGISAGKYLVSATAPAGSYLKSARYRQTDITGREFDVAGGGDMEITLRAGAAQVEGKIESEESGGGSGTQGPVYFLLAPANSTLDGSGLRFGNTDATGSFLVKDLAPGRYRVYAFASLDLAAMQNPAVLKAMEPSGADLELKENDKVMIMLHVISAQEAALALNRTRGL